MMAPARNLHINAQNKERANLHLSSNELLEAPMFLELIKAQDFTIILFFFFLREILSILFGLEENYQ